MNILKTESSAREKASAVSLSNGSTRWDLHALSAATEAVQVVELEESLPAR
jgi:hypothetical protein